MTPALYKRYLFTIYMSIAEDKGEWTQIVAKVREKNLEPKAPMNWIDVRGVLAGLINGGFVKRTNSTSEEIYYLTEKGASITGGFTVKKVPVKFEYVVS